MRLAAARHGVLSTGHSSHASARARVRELGVVRCAAMASRFQNPKLGPRAAGRDLGELRGALCDEEADVTWPGTEVTLCVRLHGCAVSAELVVQDLAVIVERAVDLLIEKLETAVLAKRKTSREAMPRARKDPGAVPRRERRAVFERDGLQCTYVGPDGRRCTAKAFLQLDHVKERARGGSGEGPNLRVRCRAHNLLEAERSFGREHVERCIDFSRRKRERTRTEAARSTPVDGETIPALAVDAEVGDKLVRALTGLGFVRARALATVKTLCAGRGPVPSG